MNADSIISKMHLGFKDSKNSEDKNKGALLTPLGEKERERERETRRERDSEGRDARCTFSASASSRV